MRAAFRLALSRLARDDVADILARSTEQFGDRASRRYGYLIETALNDLTEDPYRPLSKDRADVSPGIRTYHLACCRARAANELGAVRQPRHFLLYRPLADDWVRILRIVHDAADLDRHILEAARLSDQD